MYSKLQLLPGAELFEGKCCRYNWEMLQISIQQQTLLLLLLLQKWGAIYLKQQPEKDKHWKKKLSHFDLKSWVTGGTKIRYGIPSNWKIFESKWLDIESQFDSNILQLLGIPAQILFRQWLNFLGQNESIFSFSEKLGVIIYIKQQSGKDKHPSSALPSGATWCIGQCS